MEYISIHNISLEQNRHKKKVQSEKILKQINLTARRGEIVGILAENSIERAVLSDILSCICPPSAGSYFLDSEPVPFESDRVLAAFRNYAIGSVTERVPLNLKDSVLENVMLPLLFSSKCAGCKMRQEVGRALALFELQEEVKRVVWTLTKGEKIRVMMARAFVNHPKLIIGENLLDGLNLNQAEKVMECVQKLPGQGIATVLLMKEKEMAEYCDSLYLLKDGKLDRI